MKDMDGDHLYLLCVWACPSPREPSRASWDALWISWVAFVVFCWPSSSALELENFWSRINLCGHFYFFLQTFLREGKVTTQVQLWLPSFVLQYSYGIEPLYLGSNFSYFKNAGTNYSWEISMGIPKEFLVTLGQCEWWFKLIFLALKYSGSDDFAFVAAFSSRARGLNPEVIALCHPSINLDVSPDATGISSSPFVSRGRLKEVGKVVAVVAQHARM